MEGTCFPKNQHICPEYRKIYPPIKLNFISTSPSAWESKWASPTVVQVQNWWLSRWHIGWMMLWMQSKMAKIKLETRAKPEFKMN